MRRKVRPWDAPLIPFTGLRAGRYRYTEGEEVHLVYVTYDDGWAYATFLDVEDEDEGLMLPVKDLTGELVRV